MIIVIQQNVSCCEGDEEKNVNEEKFKGAKMSRMATKEGVAKEIGRPPLKVKKQVVTMRSNMHKELARIDLLYFSR